MSWFKVKVELAFETIFEIVAGKDNAGFGLAVADIVRSEPHVHYETHETYVLLKGELLVHIDGEITLLNRIGQSVEIPIGSVHWAESNDPEPARIQVTTIPAWTPDDHYLVLKNKSR